MKNIAVAVLIFFAASLVGGAFATGCLAPSRAAAMDEIAQVATPSCCAVEAACMGGSCFAGIHDVGCAADHGATAVAQKDQSTADLVKAPSRMIVPALSLVAISGGNISRPRSHARGPTSVSGYADIYARTGRLLI